MSKFKEYLKRLNKEQKLAINTIDGPVMIIAGPGTGKTLTLTMRIANILKKTDTDPNSILALTFTESGVKAMRERLIEIIGPTAYYVNINTFHSFCTSIINEYQETFLLSRDTTPLSELERIQIFKDILDAEDIDTLKPHNDPYYYINDLIRVIQNLKRESISPIEYKNLSDDEIKRVENIDKKINPRTNKPFAKYEKAKRDLQKQQELLKIFSAYQDELEKRKRYDFEDMINLVVAKLYENENFKLTLQEKYLYILVDEYQDTNTAQNEIIKNLTDHWDEPNIFVVGDDEQSIYRFQGASLENVLYFKKLFKKAKVITLTSNYRSSQNILDASRSLIKRNLLKLDNVDKILVSKVKRLNVPIKIAKLSTSEYENRFIVEKVKELLKMKIDPDSIAILVRNNKDIDDIKDHLIKQNIKFETKSGKNILEDGDINRLLIFLQVIHDINKKPNDDIDLFTLLNFEFLDFNKLDILKLSRFASQKRENLIEVILNKDLFSEIGLEEPKKFINFIKKLNKWQNLDINSSFTNFFGKVIQESGFLNWILADKNNVSRINNLNTLFNEIKNLNQTDHSLNLKKFLVNIKLLKENNIKIEEQTLEDDNEAVKLITAHKSKGLEFKYVFIAKCIDKKWGNAFHREMIKLPDGIIRNSQIDKKEKNEDERRLFYVALTRAKRQIFITYADKYTSGGYTKEAVPSMFISEIDKKFLKKINAKEIESEYTTNISHQLLLPKSDRDELKEEDFLNSVISNFKLNVTALNTYLRCPYKFKLNNILKTPRAKAPYLSFGTAVHKALEQFFNKFKKTKKMPTENFLLEKFEAALNEEILQPGDIKSMKKRGQKALKNYFKKNRDSFIEPLYTEYSFGYRKVYLGNIPLSGKIDKIELIDKDKKEVKVIDYKTGNPKSRGEIEGKTKNSEGDLFRQLYFYKLLAELDYNFNYHVVKGEFDFLESKPSKKAKSEVYVYDQIKLEDLKTLIKNTTKKIRELRFNRTKNYRNCEFCEFRNHCWPDGLPM